VPIDSNRLEYIHNMLTFILHIIGAQWVYGVGIKRRLEVRNRNERKKFIPYSNIYAERLLTDNAKRRGIDLRRERVEIK